MRVRKRSKSATKPVLDNNPSEKVFSEFLIICRQHGRTKRKEDTNIPSARKKTSERNDIWYHFRRILFPISKAISNFSFIPYFIVPVPISSHLFFLLSTYFYLDLNAFYILRYSERYPWLLRVVINVHKKLFLYCGHLILNGRRRSRSW